MENQTIRVNALPVLTWHRLHVNADETEAFVPENKALVVSCDGGQCGVSPLEALSQALSVPTGVGATTDAMYAQGTALELGPGKTDVVRVQVRGTSVLAVTARENSSLTLVQIWEKDMPKTALRTVIRLERGATVKLVQILADTAETCINDIGCIEADGASFETVQLYLGKENIISGIRTDLVGEKSRFACQTGYLVRSGKKLDVNVIANHLGKRTESEIHADGTLLDRAEKTFRGTIDLRQGCSGARGKETENVLLLGDDVVNKTVPLILCTEEDVDGSHGASIGELDAEMLFYFEARGISKEQAEKIVAKARLEKLCGAVSDTQTAEYMHRMIDEVI